MVCAVVKSTKLPVIASFTKAVVAIWVVLVPAVAVGATGVPVNVGELLFAFKFNAVVASVVVTKELKS